MLLEPKYRQLLFRCFQLYHTCYLTCKKLFYLWTPLFSLKSNLLSNTDCSATGAEVPSAAGQVLASGSSIFAISHARGCSICGLHSSLKSNSCLAQTAVPLEPKYRQLLDRYLLPALPYLRSHMQEVVPSVDSALVQSCLRLLNCCMRPLTCPGGKPLPSLPFLNLLRESHLFI